MSRDPSSTIDHFESFPVVVLDNGSGVLKIGFSGAKVPQHTLPVIVGQKRFLVAGKPNTRNSKEHPFYIGEEAEKNKREIAISHPMKHGVVTNWDDMTAVWDYAFKEHYGYDHDGNHLATLITEAPLNPISQRLKTAEIMFEKFRIPSLNFRSTAELNMIAVQKDTGVCLDIGDGIITAVAVHNGIEIGEIQRNDFGGRDLAKYLMRILDGNMSNDCRPCYANVQQHSNTASTRRFVMTAMEKYCFVAENVKAEMLKKAAVRNFKLPNGKDITMEDEAFRCPEALFQPARLGFSAGGLHEITCKAIQSCDEALQKTLYKNIVLCGGVAKLPGLVERLKQEITDLAPPHTEVKIKGPQNPNSAWVGGSIFGNTEEFYRGKFGKLTTKEDFEEFGLGALLLTRDDSV